MTFGILADGNEFAFQLSSNGATRPSNAAIGTTFTPGNNVKGNWVEVVPASALTSTCQRIRIMYNSISATGTAKDFISDIGIDNLNVGNYRVLCPNLLCSSAAPVANGFVIYDFPLEILAGSSIAVRGSLNGGTTDGVCWIRLWGQPRDPSRVRIGKVCQAFGINPALSTGTAIVEGTIAEGAWTSIAVIDRAYWWWQIGFGMNDNNVDQSTHFCDFGIGDALNKQIVIADRVVNMNASEALYTPAAVANCAYQASPTGQTGFMRYQTSGAGQTVSGAFYGVI